MILRIDHITKRYGEKSVLLDCSFTFDSGGVYALMGPNGSGKSTLLRICSLLERADEGTLIYSDNGTILRPDIALRRRMTLVLPRTGVFNTSVFSNVAYGLKLRQIPSSIIAQKVRNALSVVGLEDKADQNARTLSSGETQRMGLARALAIDPEILFLDEPTASVDEANTILIESIIRSLKEEGHAMVIMTTHDRDQAERLASHHLVMKHGMLSLP